METEKIIRAEAKDFYEDNITISNFTYAIDGIHELKNRLYDFYSDESKAIFLDEVETLIKFELQKHRLKVHNGESSPKCRIDFKAEKLLFYIKQEIDTLPIIAHQKFESNDSTSRTKVFISYSHFDMEFLIDVRRHFKPFVGKIDYWDDSKIIPGQKWKEEIRKAISETKVAILLISTDFLGSQFIASNELPPLLEAAEKEGAVILIVILKPCLFEEFEILNQFQAMNPPSKPIISMNESEKEELFVNLVRQTKRILEK